MIEFLKTCKNNWKTTIAGLMIALVTVMFAIGEVDPRGFATFIGAIGSMMGILSKDQDK